MTYLSTRLLAGILVPLAIGGTLAGCGDDASTTASKGAVAQSTPRPTASAKDVDQAFVRQMIPHHQMAVEMADAAETRGQHTEVKNLATAIISAQNEEIAELTKIADDLGVTADKPMGARGAGASMTNDAKTLGLGMQQMGMSMDMRSLTDADPFDLAFIDQMTPHHRGAIAMARAELAGGENAELKTIATAIITAQEKEMKQMATWRTDWYPDAADSAGTGSHTEGDMAGMGH